MSNQQDHTGQGANNPDGSTQQNVGDTTGRMVQNQESAAMQNNAEMQQRLEAMNAAQAYSQQMTQQQESADHQMQPASQQRETEKQIYTYDAEWIIYGLAFSWREQKEFRLAIGSLKEDLSNEIQIIRLNEQGPQDFTLGAKFDHNFPATKLLWIPAKNTAFPDYLATSSDYLRIWEINDEENRAVLKSELKDNNQSFSAPLTSFDWNKVDQSIIGVCSLDTTCSIWDINHENIKAQLIAHDKEVFDIAFQDTNVFCNCRRRWIDENV